MTNPKDSAYPLDPETQRFQKAGQGWLFAGLTKREYFAAMAMQGFLTAKLDSGDSPMQIDEVTAKLALVMADALIAELNKEKS